MYSSSMPNRSAHGKPAPSIFVHAFAVLLVLFSLDSFFQSCGPTGLVAVEAKWSDFMGKTVSLHRWRNALGVIDDESQTHSLARISRKLRHFIIVRNIYRPAATTTSAYPTTAYPTAVNQAILPLQQQNPGIGTNAAIARVGSNGALAVSLANPGSIAIASAGDGGQGGNGNGNCNNNCNNGGGPMGIPGILVPANSVQPAVLVPNNNNNIMRGYSDNNGYNNPNTNNNPNNNNNNNNPNNNNSPNNNNNNPNNFNSPNNYNGNNNNNGIGNNQGGTTNNGLGQGTNSGSSSLANLIPSTLGNSNFNG
mmetsp:Transcript_12027/g.21563  ORF Transcript_12027/g.21563 Transcript_12027/m.21563 type:complete len:308 (-) Transcript_12027:439-1362(-)|eukprot:CAMPEP_0175052068 /NCGR_PEP_ID=MMETSP0052_2-20121109/8156_1 /TAXON_ID=51329 ORGANISM="Polytomella parva, Strain SAG 63-3" /NCGR_SAMPLE_ID=MMETSP0052_2 /ASSEMBLY_ACC=CAM_ASM_000194 /LENGTH=307 /DNA_ID=CAMNT_0016316435 /DNA_START=365 /DNA_END=1288 /DNA_ORIENTATION=-